MLITDGESTLDKKNTIWNAEAVRRDGIQIICVGISDAIKEYEIRAISSPPHVKDVNYFLRSNFTSLQGLIGTLAEIIKEGPVELTTQTSSTANGNNGEH